MALLSCRWYIPWHGRKDMTDNETQHRIAQEALTAGVRRGGVLLVHSSLSSMGFVPGGPETVIRGLLDALGAQGTLLMPALSYEHVDAARPVFDVLKTPSNVGAIPEAFRVRPGTLRSVNPTHSVCGAGAQAALLLKDHQLDETPVGPHSPFRLLRDCGGQILFLGCGLRPNTSMHGVEELVEPPYLFGSTVAYRARLANGDQMALCCRRHNFAGFEQRYDKLAQVLTAGELRTGRILGATVHLVEAQPMWARAEAALRVNPLHFVDRVA